MPPPCAPPEETIWVCSTRTPRVIDWHSLL
jgi:hypothetical protein